MALTVCKLWRQIGCWKLAGFFAVAAMFAFVHSLTIPVEPGRRTAASEVVKVVKDVTTRAVRPRASQVKGSTDPVHVCLSSDDGDLRSSAVVIRSAYVNAANPDRLRFHFITTPELAPTVRDLFRVHLADIPVEVHADENVQDRIGNQLPGRGKTAKVRKGLTSVFNFVPFYLDQYVSIDGRPPARLIYLDTDTVIMGDLGELQDIDLQGHPCAAVKYCLQSLEKYVDFSVLRELGYIQNHDPKACIANRGLLVIDVRRWHELQITEQIEMWMQRYAESKRVLWKSGVSQPPWLLAMGDDFLDLGDEWNCNSLGREKMPYAEALFLRDNGFDHAAVRKLGAVFTEDGGVDPFVVMCSDKGKMLHFNGAVKPWTWETWFADHKLPLCALPENMPQNFNLNSAVQVKLFCKPVSFVNCVDIWNAFISEETACALRDFKQEWPEEQEWLFRLGEKATQEEFERRDREKARIQKQELEREEMKARAESQAKILKVDELAAAADAREREADKQRQELEEAER
ncbi:unnamed protein product [Durusdinium trenchii]|uniref:Hexosyltransferase n=1 Tax=Durusdinium trenchii TaxID=1381693 RepID=A0ABP0IEF5_9DINO